MIDPNGMTMMRNKKLANQQQLVNEVRKMYTSGLYHKISGRYTMALTIMEVLQNANYNLQNNGSLGLMIGMDQLKNAMDQLEAGKELYDKFEEGDE